MWIKKCVEMCVSVFKMLKKLLEMATKRALNDLKYLNSLTFFFFFLG